MQLHSSRTLWFLASLIACLFLLVSTYSFAAPPDRITSPIVAGQTVRLAAGVPMQARPKFDQGAVDPSLKMSYITLLTVPSSAQHKALNKLLADQQNPHSASYRKWLTPEQYADRFGLSPSDISKLTAWLKSQGFTVVRTARGRNWIAFSGTAAQVERTFQTEIHSFKVDGEMHFANTTPPAIPAALSGVVTGFRGLNNFRPKSQARRAQPGYNFPSLGTGHFIAPGVIATIYDVNALYTAGIDGTGQTLAVMGETGIYQSDLTNFRQNFGLSPISCTVSSDIITACNTSNFQYVLVNGTPQDIYGDIVEADIDIEWSGATARNAQVIYVTANATGVYDSLYYAIDNDVSPVMTMSYTAPCELYEIGYFDSDEAELQFANTEGITFMNSSGDTGAAECDYGSNYAEYGYAVAYPASSQYVTGVGGTLIPYTEYTATYWNPSNGTDGGSAKSYIPEEAWNDAQEWGIYCGAAAGNCNGYPFSDWPSAQAYFGIIAGGGGVSNCVTVDANYVCTGGFPQPAWQAGLNASAINPSGSGVTTTPARFSPDVSLLASVYWPGYLVCTQASFIGGSGSGSVCDSPTTGISDMLTACANGTGPCSIFGGTSVSSPVFAGMVSLLNQYLQGSANTGLGNINSMLYSLAATPGAFNPITTASSGSYSDGAWCDPGQPTSGVPGDPWPAALQCPSSGPNFLGFNTYDYDPTTNYNLAVGLGSVDLNNLATAWLDTLSTDFNLANTGSTTQTVLAGQTTPVYTFTITPVTGQIFAKEVTFACSFLPTDPTLTNTSCTFTPSSIAQGANGAGGVPVTLSITTLGPNPAPVGARKPARRADNRLPWLPLSLPLAGVVMVGFAGRKLSKYSVVASLCLALALAGLLVACGSSSPALPPPPISVSVGQGNPASLYPNNPGPPAWPSQTATFTATVSNDSSGKGVTWTAVTGTIASTGATTATYTAPTIASGLPASDTITATSVADTTKTGKATETLLPATVPNTYTVTVTATEGSTTQTQDYTLQVN